MEECGFDRLVIIPEQVFHPSGNGDGVTLVGVALCPEHAGACIAEVVVDVLLIHRTGRFRPQMAEEPFHQMPSGPEALLHDEDLHLTHRRDVGRYAIRSAPIDAPHRSQVP